MRSNEEGLQNLKSKKVQIDPLAVTESLGFQTFRRDTRKPWTKEEDEKLMSVISHLYPLQNNSLEVDSIKWDIVAQNISPSGLRKPKDCRKRWSNSLDPSLKKGKWTKLEDEQLVKAYEKFGPSWQKVSGEINGRTDDQCAKRYIEVLDPNTKDRLKPWEREEDLKLIRLVKAHGTKWRTIANELAGRPSLTCRNRWRKLVTEVVRGKADLIIKSEVDLVTQGTSKLLGSFKDGTMIESGDIAEPSFRSSLSNTYSENLSSRVSEHSNTLARQKPQPSGISRPVHRKTEWTYALTDDRNDQNALTKHLFGANGGNIKNQELAQYLVSYAQNQNLKIDIHQHIHHHYPPAPSENNNFLNYQSMHLPGIINQAPSPDDFSANRKEAFMDSEPLKSRYQHFNYLPPLTEVPKLNSSRSLNEIQRSEPPQHHHHHHHHHHSIHDTSRENDRETYRQSLSQKEATNLEKLLNQNDHQQSSGSLDASRTVGEESMRSGSLTPLTHAVELAAAAEANVSKRRPSNSSVNGGRKRSKQNTNDTKNKGAEDEEGDGFDFWNAMRNLTDMATQQNNQTSPSQRFQEFTQSRQKPVSQHHPLHYSRGSTTPQPQVPQNLSHQQRRHRRNSSSGNEDYEELDEEVLNSYGLFYNVYTKEGSTLPETQPQKLSLEDDMIDLYGTIPFNPS
ncbi:uncharacterized protein PRCAT00002038001 [Priceomyces carsonii]|uniref:uncharacterized protein n=1 Tax=Priceomyces carsonii TaxID=28549 RepID=UPI002ED7EED6|nr:unnamed protein product [Priceomyces carsonii]